jgi:hypothetical protein
MVSLWAISPQECLLEIILRVIQWYFHSVADFILKYTLICYYNSEDLARLRESSENGNTPRVSLPHKLKPWLKTFKPANCPCFIWR